MPAGASDQKGRGAGPEADSVTRPARCGARRLLPGPGRGRGSCPPSAHRAGRGPARHRGCAAGDPRAAIPAAAPAPAGLNSMRSRWPVRAARPVISEPAKRSPRHAGKRSPRRPRVAPTPTRTRAPGPREGTLPCSTMCLRAPPDSERPPSLGPRGDQRHWRVGRLIQGIELVEPRDPRHVELGGVDDPGEDRRPGSRRVIIEDTPRGEARSCQRPT